jgi:hypothetical protein
MSDLYEKLKTGIINGVKACGRTCMSGGMKRKEVDSAIAIVTTAADNDYFAQTLADTATAIRAQVMDEYAWKDVCGDEDVPDPSWPTETGTYYIRLSHDGETGEFGSMLVPPETWTEVAHLEVYKEEGVVHIDVQHTVSGNVEWRDVDAWCKLPNETYEPMTDWDEVPPEQQKLDLNDPLTWG